MLLALDSDELTEAVLLTRRSDKLLLQMPAASPPSRLLRGIRGLRGRNSVSHTNLPVGMLSLLVYPLIG